MIIKIVPRINRIIVFENIFIDSLKLVFCGGRAATINKSVNQIIDFFVLVFSFAVIEVVYINSVIIPEEKVRIVTKAIHLEFVVLNTEIVIKIDKTRIEIETNIGFKVRRDFIEKIEMSIDVFL